MIRTSNARCAVAVVALGTVLALGAAAGEGARAAAPTCKPGGNAEPFTLTARALATYIPRPLVRRLAGRTYRRTPEAVIAEYEGARGEYLRAFDACPPPLDDYLLFEADQRSPGRTGPISVPSARRRTRP